jgi:hypothetical protein
VSDARESVRFAILDAVARNAYDAGLRAGPAVERMVEDVIQELFYGQAAWATRALLEETGAAA